MKNHFSVKEVARHFGVNPSTVYRLAQKGVLPAFKVGNQWRFSQEMLDAWVAHKVTVREGGSRGNSR
jgi:excisionase family DNA binding protein